VIRGGAALLAAAWLWGAAAAQIPRQAAEIEFSPVTGGSGKRRLTDYRGKVVAIEFLLTGCPGCKLSARILSKLHREYAGRGFEVIGLAVDPGAQQRVPVFAAETGAMFPIAVFSDTAAREWLQAPLMMRMSYPQLAFVDRKGMVREHFRGEDPRMSPDVEEANIRKVVEALLAEGDAARKKPRISGK
jgi:peroxiredoxin